MKITDWLSPQRLFLPISIKIKGNEPLNLGTSRKRSIRDLITLICELMELTGKSVWETDKLNSQHRGCLDAQGKLRAFYIIKLWSDFKKGHKNEIKRCSIHAA